MSHGEVSGRASEAASIATPRAPLPRLIQRRLQALYGVETPPVEPFVCASPEGREVLEVRSSRGTVELRLHLPEEAMASEGAISVDVLCQVAEGVSHFVFIAERARRELPATQLELELQAEVDKFLLLSGALAPGDRDSAGRAHRARERLFENVTFLHRRGTARGDRYRLANRLAARVALKIERAFSNGLSASDLVPLLRAFFGAGQREKIEMALAA